MSKKFDGKNVKKPWKHSGASSKQQASSTMPQDVHIGDIYLMNLRSDPQKKAADGSQIRPVIIWSIYRDADNRVRAVDIINTTGLRGRNAQRNLYTSELLIDTEEERRLACAMTSEIINPQSVTRMPWKSISRGGAFLDHAKRKGSIDPSIVPHLVIRRINAIKDGNHLFTDRASVDASFSCETLWLPTIDPDKVKGTVPPEIDCGCQRIVVPFGGLSQGTVDVLGQYYDACREAARQSRQLLWLPHAATPLEMWEGWVEFAALIPELDAAYQQYFADPAAQAETHGLDEPN